MSNPEELPSQSAAYEVIKKEKRTKKEKRDKSSQIPNKTEEDPMDVDSDTTPKVTRKEKSTKEEKKAKSKDIEVGDSEDEAEDKATSKKRKREALPDELEIDITLPEPASKKAARKAKKVKTAPATTANGITSDKPTPSGTTDASGKRSEFGVWIGNLPWSATKDSLLAFLTTNSDITSAETTRVHLPPPTKPPNPNWTMKPLNKGFAYVDFSTQLAMYSAIALTETKMDGRALLIKNAKSFEGRPEKPAGEAVAGKDGKTDGKQGHPPNKRVFVGNLAFDVSKEDLQTHYAQCGEILDIHMATFEDSGKCKGYAWITFENEEIATSAVKGYIFKEEKDKKEGKKKKSKTSEDSESEQSDDKKEKRKKPEKKRKWYVNQLMGRELRCEFAEDSTVRYNKRHGKKKDDADMTGLHPDRLRQLDSDAPNERPPRANRPFKPRPKVDARTIPSGRAHMSGQRASHAIVEAKGKKISFD